jgi:hypothetical protein
MTDHSGRRQTRPSNHRPVGEAPGHGRHWARLACRGGLGWQAAVHFGCSDLAAGPRTARPMSHLGDLRFPDDPREFSIVRTQASAPKFRRPYAAHVLTHVKRSMIQLGFHFRADEQRQNDGAPPHQPRPLARVELLIQRHPKPRSDGRADEAARAPTAANRTAAASGSLRRAGEPEKALTGRIAARPATELAGGGRGRRPRHAAALLLRNSIAPNRGQDDHGPHPDQVPERGGRKLVVTPDGAIWAPRPRVDNAMVRRWPGRSGGAGCWTRVRMRRWRIWPGRRAWTQPMLAGSFG